MKKYVKASYETKFWNLHDSGFEAGTALEAIIDDFGMTDKFFPEDGEPEATEEDYADVLREYEGGGSTAEVIDVSDVLDEIRLAAKATAGVKRVDWMDEIDALRFTLDDGHTYQLVLQDLGRR